MRRRFLRAIAEMTFRFAGLVSLILILLTAMSISGARRLKFDTGLADFLPPNSARARLIGEMLPDYRNLEPVIVNIRALEEGSEAGLIDLANEMGELLNNPLYFKKPVYKVDALAQQYYESLSDVRLIALMTDEDWEYLTDLMQMRISTQRLEMTRAKRLSSFLPKRPEAPGEDPLGVLGSIRERISQTRAPIPITPRHGYFFSRDGRSLQMLLYPIRPAGDALHAFRADRFLSESLESLDAMTPQWRSAYAIEFIGSHIDAARKLRSMLSDLRFVTIWSAVFVLLLIILTFRKIEAIVFALLPPVLGLVWTLGLAHAFCLLTGINAVEEFGVIRTRVTSVTFAFLIITFGIGLCYSLHLFHRFTFELYRTRNYYRALQIAYVETGRGLLASAMISAIIFFLLYLTSFRGLKELGILAAVAILCNLCACMLTAPTLAALKSWLAKGKVQPIALYRIKLSWLSAPAVHAPRATLIALLLVTVFLGVGFGADGIHVKFLELHPKFTSIAAYLFRPDDLSTPNKEMERWPGRPLVAIVEGETIQEALEKNDWLYEELIRLMRDDRSDYGILAVDSLRVVLPALVSQRRSLDTLKSLDLEPLDRSIAVASRRAGFQPVVFERFLQQISDLQDRSVDAELTEYSSASGEALVQAVQRLVTSTPEGTYRVATPIYPTARGFTETQIDRVILQIDPSKQGVTFVGDPIVERELSVRLRYDLALFVLLSSLAIFIGLVLHFGGIRYAVIAFVATLAPGLWVAGIMNLAGVTLHFFTLMAAPLIITLVLDNSIQLLQNYRDRQGMDVNLSLVTLGRAIVLTCGSVGLLYGPLGVAEFEGLGDLGLVVTMGAIAALVSTLMLLPALIQLWGRDQSLASVFQTPGGPR